MFLSEWETYSDRYHDDGSPKDDEPRACEHPEEFHTQRDDGSVVCEDCGETV